MTIKNKRPNLTVSQKRLYNELLSQMHLIPNWFLLNRNTYKCYLNLIEKGYVLRTDGVNNAVCFYAITEEILEFTSYLKNKNVSYDNKLRMMQDSSNRVEWKRLGMNLGDVSRCYILAFNA